MVYSTYMQVQIDARTSTVIHTYKDYYSSIYSMYVLYLPIIDLSTIKSQWRVDPPLTSS